MNTSQNRVEANLSELPLDGDLDLDGLILPTDDGMFADMPSYDNELPHVSEAQITAAISPAHRGFTAFSIHSLQPGSSVLTGLPCIVNDHQGSDVLGIGNNDGMQWQLIRSRMGSLTRLRPADPVSQHNARLIMQTMRTYPYMMLRRETFPPFIHPHWHRHSAPALPWPLANCMGIANIFISRSTETAPFLWSAVQKESQRCLDEVRFRVVPSNGLSCRRTWFSAHSRPLGKMNSFSDECLLAAIQVQVMYLVMRLIDGATQPSELDVQLLVTFKVCSAVPGSG